MNLKYRWVIKAKRFRNKSTESASHGPMNQATGKSKVEVQTLVLGLPRCATTSIAAALESDVLGIRPALHASDTSTQRHRTHLILDALHLQGESNVVHRRAKLQEFIDGYAACTESLNVLADDLMDMYPKAKLILNVRPPPRNGESAGVVWARSCNETIAFFGSRSCLVACWPLRQYWFWWRRYRLQTDLWRLKGLLPRKASSLLTPKGCEWMNAEFYDRYLDWIQCKAKERDRDILIWHPGMGWQPLCELFERELPLESTMLPCLNDTRTSKMGQRDYVRRGLLRYAMFAMLCLISWWMHSGLSLVV